MDRSDRASAYRGLVVRCAGCGSVMRREPVPSAEVDVCDACGGLWVDWFDGEVQTLAVEAEAARASRGTPLPRVPPAASSTRTCPQCGQPLTISHHRFPDATDGELVSGVDLFRCSECFGSFVPHASAHLLLDRVRDPRPMTLWEAFVALLRGLVRPTERARRP